MTKNSCEKLNSIHLTGITIIGIIVGLISGSWGLFLVVFIALTIASIATHELRLPPKRPRRRR